MIRHFVMWKIRGPSAEERYAQAEQVRAALLSMVGKVPGMTSVEVGIAKAGGEQECDVAGRAARRRFRGMIKTCA